MLVKNEKITQGATEGCFSMEMSNEEYHAEKGYLSTSGMKLLLQSPAHFKQYERAETPDMAMGIALHMILLEPEKFLDTYVVYAGGDKRGKEYNEFAKDYEGKIIIKPDVMSRLSGMRESVLSHPKNLEQFFREGKKEFSIFWEDPETGVGLKVRTDNLFGNTIFDLKKTQDARPDKFVRRCWDLRYDIQAYNYKTGVRNYLGLDDVRFMFVAVEDKAPYGVWVYESSPEMERRGKEDARKAINLYARCQRENKWPMYDDPLLYKDGPFSQIEWPHWAAAKEDLAGA